MNLTYATRTYNSRNPLKRLSHRARFAVAVEYAFGEVLDYGCGDGHFRELMKGRASVTNFDPVENNAPRKDTLRSLDGVTKRFDCITCLEVLEHLPEAATETFFSDTRRLLKPGGTVIISVPVMIGPSGFAKMLAGLGRQEGYTISAAFRHLVGKPGPRILLPWGTYDHDGFDYRALRTRIAKDFASVEEVLSPFPKLPSGLNSQVAFVCRDLKHRSDLKS